MHEPKDPKDMTDAELAEALAAFGPNGELLHPPSATSTPPDGPSFSRVRIAWPGAKVQLTFRLDQEILDWFRADGPGYQTRINAVLRAFVNAQPRRRR